jgi:hypothetical protein
LIIQVMLQRTQTAAVTSNPERIEPFRFLGLGGRPFGDRPFFVSPEGRTRNCRIDGIVR